MKLIYAFTNRLLSQAAPPLQVTHNCSALARKAEVHLLAQKGYTAAYTGERAISSRDFAGKDVRQAAAEYYGVELPDSLHLHLLPQYEWRLGRQRIHIERLYHLACLNRIRRLQTREHRADAILVRNLRIAQFLLKARRTLSLPPVIYEAHEVYTVTFREQMKQRGIERPKRDAALSALESYVCTNASGIVCVTHHIGETIRRLFGSECEMTALPNGAYLPDAQPKQPGGGVKMIMYLGSLHDWKGVDVLIQAMSNIPGAVLRIVGGDDRGIQRHREFARKFDVEDKVRFDGYVAPGERFNRLSEADVLVLPLRPFQISTYFTSPLKIFEYMAARRPIVTSDLPSTRELLENDVNAMLVPPADPRALADGITRILGDPDLGHRLADRAAADVLEYTWDKRADRLIEFTRRVIARDKGFEGGA